VSGSGGQDPDDAGSGDDPTVTLELNQVHLGPGADLPEVYPEEQFAYEAYVEKT
jgi:hypothetical protein